MAEGAVSPSGLPSGSRRDITEAARALFAERGYRQVTIRDIAAKAGISPALVIKHGGSKEELFHATATITPPPLPNVAAGELGHALVADLIARHRRGDLEHLARSLMLRLNAPDPDAVRERFLLGYVEPLAGRLDGARARLRAELAVAALSGLAVSLRIFETPALMAETGPTAELYGAVVQGLVDED